MATRKKFVLVGTGGRSEMFWKAIAEDHKDNCELLAICDINPGRLEQRRKDIAELGVEVKTYPAAEFDRMIADNKPDEVIVTTKDSHHHEYICRALELGCNVITEKPMTIDAEKCQQIIDTQKKTGKKCRVTFNYRYAPPRTQLKDLLMKGEIGNVVSVDFHWMLNTTHGADYFRRWHRNKVNSGGLMVHKATHHFDLVNWWLSSVPVEVSAIGRRNFYTPKTAERYGLTKRGERCLDCPEAERCPFHMDMKSMEIMNKIYLQNEEHDGYYRDRCVFSDQIDIEDTMHVMVDYASGATMSYSLHAFSPWEGFTITFNGTKGRIEHVCMESTYHNGDGTIPGELKPEGTHTRIYPHFKPGRDIELWTGTGGHGGGDPVLLEDILSVNPPQDPYMRAADQRAGAYSILTGIAANQSFISSGPIKIPDLVNNIGMPDYPVMPTGEEPLPIPEKGFEPVSG